ncbi:unnamed protein product [Coffea canephora]|uniref:NmrA-like domain-containing protein n=1 Tax=Coffea canephora TaxID=49390 RepID=A0A068V186_COFCA|nr:unnamed protein product [Coffea canephora]
MTIPIACHIKIGDLYDHESLVKAIKQVDVVISTVGQNQLDDQGKIIDAIKEAGNVKRFYPSEFGVDVDRQDAVGPVKFGFGKQQHSVIHFHLLHLIKMFLSSAQLIPYIVQHDVGTFTIKTVDDPRTLNKVVYINPPKNRASFNELVAIWEKKIGITLETEYISEEQLLKNIQEAPSPLDAILSINHAILVNGTSNFPIEPSFGVETSELYPDVKYTTVEEFLHQFV